MRYRARGAAGFTLIELMVVVAMMGVIAGLAIWTVRKQSLQSEVADWSNQFVQAVNQARRRAVSTRNVYMLDVRASQLQWCLVDPANTTQNQCPPTTAGLERGPVVTAKPGAIFRKYASAADAQLDSATYVTPTRTDFGGNKLLMFFGPNGTVADSYAHAATSGNAVPGFSVYAEPTYGQSSFVTQKRLRVIVLGPSGRTRVITGW